MDKQTQEQFDYLTGKVVALETILLMFIKTSKPLGPRVLEDLKSGFEKHRPSGEGLPAAMAKGLRDGIDEFCGAARELINLG